ncbi:MAG: Zn-dependent hydrolase [Gammaproteobacteria bacterium]|nr:Zn-dependent hydrolase [Gammaproteobacteria bacterium]
MHKINFSRLQKDIEELASIGRSDDDKGLYRMAFSDGDMAGRAWLKAKILAAGLDFYQDGAANLHARYNWNEDTPSVITGSHIDTIPGAGHLDGALGVVTGLECLRTLKENNIALKYPLECIAFSDEEGRFGGMFGSQAFCGQLTPESIYNAVDLGNVAITDAMASHGLNATDALQARRNPKSIHAFVELHIEQGPVLDSQNISIGVVDAIAGLFKWNVTLKGAANHAGTTPMSMRQDAFQGLAEIATQLNRILEEYGSQRSVATIGRVSLFPGAANVVPGVVEFTLEVRDTDAQQLKDLGGAFRRSISAIARRRDLMFEFEILSELPPVKCDPGIVQTVHQSARALNVSSLHMHSGAAHDTQILAQITRAGMIFVPSKDGRSHSPAEWTNWEDIEIGANVLINTLYQLASN